MGELLKSVFCTSLSGSLAAVMALGIVILTRKIADPVRQYYLYLTAAAVFLLPWRIPSGDKTVYVSQGSFSVGQTENSLDAITVLGWVWLLTAICIACMKILKYVVFKRTMLRESQVMERPCGVPERLKIVRCNLSVSPMIVGIMKPVLFMPDVSDSESEYILRHEIIHYKRKDTLLKWIMETIKVIHWFNPLAYCIACKMDEACETACDYTAVGECNETERKRYMRVILDLAERSVEKRAETAVYAVKDKKIMKRRFDAIMKFKTRGKREMVFSAVCAAMLLTGSIPAGGAAASALGEDKIIYQVSEDLTGGFLLPDGKVSAPYGKDHDGIDYAGDNGKSVLSAEDGVVTYADYDPSYGNMVEICHKDGYTTRYAHMQSMDVCEGDSVNKGGKIGEIGSTGMSTGPHLHFEVRKNGSAVDPKSVE